MGSFQDERTLLYVGLAICVGIITYLSLSQRQKEVVYRRLTLRGRRSSSADTPPRSLSPEKKEPNNSPPKSSEYVNTFPPLTRENLVEAAASLPEDRRAALQSVTFDEKNWTKSILGFGEDFRKADSNKYVYTGYKVEEIRALGDFPDYAALSGVPLPKPYHEHDINKALPRPYRPFRWAYHQTMSLTKLEPDWWLELENTYVTRIAQRKKLYAEHGEAVLQWLPGSELACKELMEMALQFLCARYPQYFSLGSDKKTFENKILGTKQDVSAKHPLLVLLDNVPEDFAIMLRNPETGYYHFRAGMICSALGWNVGTKIGMQLHQIHAPIPDYKEKMQFSMDRFFTKMPSPKPIQRGSWGLEVDQPLYMPPGDPHEKYRDFQSPDLDLSRIHLRVDWQTLRRLPLSGGIVFNFKALFTPVSEFRSEPYIPSLVLKVLRDGKENLMKYKNTWHVEHVVIPALEEYEREQIQKGIVEKDWQHHTLDESPWFPGWKEKWVGQQGFGDVE
ncbi:uncharacterized protein Z520_11379 [Fonsecaea multimorphosa CBS 102226]|uniref:Alpha-1,2-mannosyltransferase n=1 Tax=Fonsecaea multimorphosa CBS 102226 TaxID=1442371 RepID=A0A0D2K986_9EURO|nr:uncharacterized protein Z520_11379 [Fonsecaea multimorphosa CBS 102226]KIX92903.1 hypothetical protein Z520_11379 [Fonsecaea multimorphosa CBS 102226]OAL18153.1 hypothetical protein AYO22_10930 [Fonsecaea multimorphosa]